MIQKLLVLFIVVSFSLPAAGVVFAADDPLVIADSVFDTVDEAMVRAEKARQVYDRVRNLGKPAAEVQKAKDDVTRAEADLGKANAALDSARIHALAEAGGVSDEQVRAMRASGKGWGAIAGELGVHPSVVKRGAKKNAHAGGTMKVKGKKPKQSDQKGKGKKK